MPKVNSSVLVIQMLELFVVALLYMYKKSKINNLTNKSKKEKNWKVIISNDKVL